MTGNIYNSLVRACVPLFFMISGLLLLEKIEPTSTFLNKRLKKIVIPTVIWSLIYIAWKILYEKQKLGIGHTLLATLISPSYYHLWFIYATIGLYLAVPILRKFVNGSSNSNMAYFLIIWFFCTAILPLVEKLIGTKSRYDIGMYTGYAGYLVLGSFLGRFTYSSKHAMIAAASLTTGTLIVILGTYYLTVSHNSFDDTFYGYLSPAVVLSAAAWFVLFKYIFGDSRLTVNPTLEKTIISLSSLSFGIYLIHALFISALKTGAFGFKITILSGDPVLWIPITVFITLLLSWATIWVISKTPILRKTV